MEAEQDPVNQGRDGRTLDPGAYAQKTWFRHEAVVYCSTT